MEEVFAAFTCGFALAIITTPIIAVWLVRSRDVAPAVARVFPGGVPPVLLAVPAANAAFLFWTGLGIVFGLLLIAANDASPQGALGSPNILFTVIIVATAVILFLPPVVIARRTRPLLLLFAGLFVAGYGWVTPLLAELAAR